MTAFFVVFFFRLASLLPSLCVDFDRSRFPYLGDVIWGLPGARIVMTCAKNTQNSGDMHVVQLPLLSSSILCRVSALKDMVKYVRQGKDDPLFLFPNGSGYKPLTAHRACSFIKLSVATIGLYPKHFTLLEAVGQP